MQSEMMNVKECESKKYGHNQDMPLLMRIKEYNRVSENAVNKMA